MANADYTNLSDTEKKNLRNKYVKQFRSAFKGWGTNEELAARLVKQLREVGSSDLVNDINREYDEQHGKTLREAIIGDYSFKKEDRMLNSLGFAIDRAGDSMLQLENLDKDRLILADKDPEESSFELIDKDRVTIPDLEEDGKKVALSKRKVKLGSGVQKYIKGAGKTPKATESTPAPESTPTPAKAQPTKNQPVSKLPAPIDASSSTMLGEAMGGGGGFAPTATPPRGGLPQSVLNIIHGGKAPYQKDATDPFAPTTETKETTGKQLGPTRELAKTLKAAAPATPAATGGSSGSGTGLDYLRSREERKQRDKAGKADIAEEQIAGRARAEGRFSGMKREILAQQAERDRITKEKSDANKIAIEGAGGKEELLGRVIRDKSGKVIGHSTTSAGRRALGDPYKGVKGGAMDFDKPAESYAELDMRDAAKQRMGSKQQQVMDLWSKGASSEQRKQIAPLREGLGVDPDKIQPFEGAGKTKLDIDATVNEGFHTSDEVAKAPKMELSPKPQNMPNIGREDPMIPQAKPREVESVGSRLQREEGERKEKDFRNKQLKLPDLGLAYDKERDKRTKATKKVIDWARSGRSRRS